MFVEISLNEVLRLFCDTNDRLRMSELQSEVVNASGSLVGACQKYRSTLARRRPYFGPLHVMTGGLSWGRLIIQ